MKYKILALILILFYFIQSFFIASGGVGADSLSYFGMASDLPQIKTNLFPIAYPFLIKILQLVIGDYYWAAKILNTLFIVLILSFSYFKKFYFKETVLLFTGKTLFFVYCGILSEGLFIFLLYFLLYFLYNILVLKSADIKNYFACGLLLVLLVMTRYSGIYIYLSLLSFITYVFIKYRNIHFLKVVFISFVLGGIGVLFYLLSHYYYFGNLTGEHLRGRPSDGSVVNIIRNILGYFNVINPYLGIKPSSMSWLSLAVQFGVFIGDIIFLIILFYLFKNYKNSPLQFFYLVAFNIIMVYSTAVLISGYFQQIEEMNVRMMAASNFCLFFIFLIRYFEEGRNEKLLFKISCSFFLFILLYSIKMPSNFYANRNQIEKQMPQHIHKKYLYNNEKDITKITQYHLPIIDKKISYNHTQMQIGELKQNLAGSLNPQIKWTLVDTIKNKKQVLYTSELILKD